MSDFKCLFAIDLLAAPEERRTGHNAATLIWLFEQLGRSQRTVGAQRLGVLLAETGHLLKCGHNERYGRQLCLRIGYLILVQREGLRHKFIRHSLVICITYLANNQSALQIQAQRQIRQIRFGQCTDCAVTVLHNLLTLLVPVLILFSNCFVFKCQLISGEHKWRQDMLQSLAAAVAQMFARYLQHFVLHVRLIGLQEVYKTAK